MRKNVLVMLLLVGAMASVANAIDAHWNPGVDPNRPAGTTELWSDGTNWSTTIAPNAADQVVWMATANTAPCLLEPGTWQINQLKLGEGGDGSNNGNLIVKGILNTNLTGNWQGIAAWGTQVATLEIDGGQFNTYGGGHLWCGNQGHGTVIIKNEGQLNVGIGGGAQLGLGWDGGVNAWGRVYIYDGLVTVNNWTDGSIHPATQSFYDIYRGTLSIQGYRFGGTSGVDVRALSNHLRGYNSANFDKKINIDDTGNPDPANHEGDIINNVKLTWDAPNNRTVVTAVHPVQPSPAYNQVVQYGDVTFEWNNWDPNQPGDSVIVDVWFGTEPNKLSPNYTKVVTAMNVTGQTRSSVVINVPTAGKYYWQVDTNNGAAHEGDVFWFTSTDDLPPTVDAGNGIITWVGEPVQLNGTVTDDHAAATLAWTSDPAANAAFSSTTIEDPTATFAATGTYVLTLTANDGFNPAVSDTTAVTVFADACSAARDGTNNRPATDIVVDCVIDLNDFAELAFDWLLDYALTTPQ